MVSYKLKWLRVHVMGKDRIKLPDDTQKNYRKCRKIKRRVAYQT